MEAACGKQIKIIHTLKFDISRDDVNDQHDHSYDNLFECVSLKDILNLTYHGLVQENEQRRVT